MGQYFHADDIPFAEALPEETHRSRRPLVIALCIVIPIAAIALLGWAGWYLVNGVSRPVGDAERAIVVLAEDVEKQLTGLDKIGATIEHTKLRYLDGSYEVTYSFDTREGVPAFLFLFCSATGSQITSNAVDIYRAATIDDGVPYFLAGTEGYTTVRTENVYRWGDESKLFNVEYDGGPAGFIFVARKGTKVFMLRLLGLILEDRKDFAELLDRPLAALDEYKP